MRFRSRLNDARNYKIPILIAVPYVIIYVCKIDFAIAVKFLLLSFVTIAGIAGYAYLMNDWADEKEDVTAGKPNIANGLSGFSRIVIMLLFFTMAVAPWFLFPFAELNIALLVVELFLFYAYSFPPLRTKERPVAGVVTDALYAHAVPCLLAALTFIEIAEEARGNNIRLLVFGNCWLLFLLIAWQLVSGIRSILLHQLDDLSNDISTGTNTFTTILGGEKTKRLLMLFILPTEIVLLMLYLLYLGKFSLVIPAMYLIFVAYFYFMSWKMFVVNYRTISYELLDNFYLDWLPLAVLIPLVLVDWKFAILLLLHMLLFRNIVTDLLKRTLTR